MQSTNLIQVDTATFGYEGKPVVRVEHLEVRAGKCLGIFGPNGSGKTTLVRGITGLLPPLSGKVVRGEQAVRFGYMPQQRAMELHWPMTGFDAAAMAMSARRPLGWIGRWIGRDPGCIRDAMRQLGVENLQHKPFAKLSGGQQQRILLAGALAAEPSVLVLDEPTEGLDVSSRRTLLEMLARQTARQIAAVIISHEVEDLMLVCHEIAWLHVGTEEAQPSTVEMIPPQVLAERMARMRGLA